jgi:hypothetical protein
MRIQPTEAGQILNKNCFVLIRNSIEVVWYVQFKIKTNRRNGIFSIT